MRFALVAVGVFLSFPAIAAPWKIDSASTLTFTGTQADEAFTGHFKTFTPVVEFDPAKPEAGKIVVTVDMNSATISDADKQESLPTEDWFHTGKFPKAIFTSSTISRVSGKENAYLAEGTLQLRDVSKPLQIPFSLRVVNGITHVEGGVVLQRNAFGVGQGQWKDDQWIAFPVEVKFHLQAAPPTS